MLQTLDLHVLDEYWKKLQFPAKKRKKAYGHKYTPPYFTLNDMKMFERTHAVVPDHLFVITQLIIIFLLINTKKNAKQHFEYTHVPYIRDKLHIIR